MRWYLLVLVILFDGIHSKPAIAFNKDVHWLAKRQTPFTSAQLQCQQDALTSHNAYRTAHCVSKLTLDDGLSHAAQAYAETLAATNTFVHSGTSGVGENLYKITWSICGNIPVNCSSSTDDWYSEIKNYNYAKAEFDSTTGHFTQLVWQSTKAFGVGFALSPDKCSIIIVARYSPPGNYIDKFPTNVLPKSC